MAVGTATFTYTEHATVNKMSIDWTASSSGIVPATASKIISGELLRCVFVPDSGGTAPTNNYDMTIVDSESVDVLSGNGANLSSTVTKSIVPCEEMLSGGSSGVAKFAIMSALTISASNCGASNGGNVHIYYR